MSQKQNQHYNNLRRIFGKYMRTLGKDTQDVWLMSGVDKKMIAGHQFVLGACSQYFDSIFNELNEAFAENAGSDKQKVVLIMSACSSKTLEKMIDFMYKGPDELHDDSEDKDWNDLYALGQEFEIYGLLESILEKRKMKKDENGNTENDGIDLNFGMTKKINPDLMDLDEFLSGDYRSKHVSTLVPTKIGAEEKEISNKEKWIEKSEKIMVQIRNGSKEKPTTARKFLNDIFSNSIKFKPAQKGLLLEKTFCVVEIDGLEFTGDGNTVDEARETAALKVLHTYLNLKFPIN